MRRALKVWCIRERAERVRYEQTIFGLTRRKAHNFSLKMYIKHKIFLRFKKALEKLLDFPTDFPLFWLFTMNSREITTLWLVIVYVQTS